MCKKDVRRVVKGLRKYAVSGTFKIVQKNHTKVTMESINDNGNLCKLRFILPVTPQDGNWMKSFERQKAKYLNEQNISF